MTNNAPYQSASIIRIVGFKEMFPEIKPFPTIESLLVNISRKQLIKTSQTLTNVFREADFQRMQSFFSPKSSYLKKEFNNRFHKIVNPKIKFIFCTIQTCTEFLKYSYSITSKPLELTNEEFEERILKALLIINQNLTDYKSKHKNKNTKLELAELLLVNSFSQKDINNFDYNKTFREYFTKSIDLFEYVSSDSYLKPIYEEFIIRLQIASYKEYLITILGIFIIILQNAQNTKRTTSIEQWAGTFIYHSSQDPDKLIKTSVLDYISLPWDSVISLEDNKDYKLFRSNPLMKFPDNSYEIQNPGFVIEKLFYSLYFDFSAIAKDLNIKNFSNQYKENFGEKTLLCKYVELSNTNQRYTGLSSHDSRQISLEGGEPDYYLKSKDGSVILFENKDIFISADVKQDRDFQKIIDEYKNKLLLKTHSNGKPVRKTKPEGIGQLVSQIKKIQDGIAFWDKTAPRKSFIYPVLVISDYKLLPDGLAYLMQDWYKNDCISRHIDTVKAKPLILLSISTILLYSKEFQENGFEYYFERYYKSIFESETKKPLDAILSIYNASVSFSEYMENVYSKDFIEVYDSYRVKLFSEFK
jgi:hypothetical protein